MTADGLWIHAQRQIQPQGAAGVFWLWGNKSADLEDTEEGWSSKELCDSCRFLDFHYTDTKSYSQNLLHICVC